MPEPSKISSENRVFLEKMQQTEKEEYWKNLAALIREVLADEEKA